ncbi:lipopolysaccharide biosynthesis protein [Chryseobacterium sp. MDT2-18]|uniref:lipopolysaccharide biosynthesis protein n=1 Tax=Chryseobacterium sp. MDT2-18 TaxID=1259136 RepID=UPI0027D79496|nr:polysaccharide biosynthesis C-terminal domain-containing protein [Chryseobacterium sp. MDT2-18]
MFSLLSANINLFIGRKDIRRFNLYTILQQLVHFLFLIVLIYVVGFEDVATYFIAQIFCYTILFFLSSFQILSKSKLSNFTFSIVIIVAMFSYGWKTQLSAFIQFLNYRLSFYFLEYFQGIATVGVFSIGVAFSEAIWTLSRSLAVILYADVINSKNEQDSITKTKSSLKITLFVTVFFLAIMLLVPEKVYTVIFSKDFYQTKKIILLLSPGIVAIAVSNIIGYYFAGTNRLGILNVKSVIGFLITICLSFYAIPKWGIFGACLVTTVSYCVSSGVLFWKFFSITNFKIQDYLISKSDLNLYLRKIVRKLS